MELLKEMIQINKIDKAAFIRAVSEKLSKKLKNKKIHAFGPEGDGWWGSADNKKEFTISSVDATYVDEDHLSTPGRKRAFVSLDVALNGYNSKDNGLIYTDQVFINELKKLFEKYGFRISCDYSEQGMQGNNTVNLDADVYIDDFIRK